MRCRFLGMMIGYFFLKGKNMASVYFTIVSQLSHNCLLRTVWNRRRVLSIIQIDALLNYKLCEVIISGFNGLHTAVSFNKDALLLVEDFTHYREV